ncbi:MAG TPA: phytoene/squalene synthase family protein [Candidatus Agrococcus pullicola]|uniref:Phytoene/squalene synthase family protein n=1 Tax=Candidatus Agrococcus pullicola TaxID=2838429 RepID=A0A9D1YT23_9MICO|nr:phytoene/squalene synthase family protein [Candidatus Agrococcus pullicola]
MTGLDLYTRVCRETSAAVIAGYSTSFSLASRLLPSRIRGDIRTVYALVRIADEIVDGPGAEAGLGQRECGARLDALEGEVAVAIAEGFSQNPIVHAFAETAARVDIDETLTKPFFASMRRDLEPVSFTDEEELRAYVYGSAEVVGLMCIRCFTSGARVSPADADRIETGARALGNAFQLVNFLRDLGADGQGLGRSYLPGVDPASPDALAVRDVLDTIESELRVARAAIPMLPRRVRPAVLAAHDLFAELAARIRKVPAPQLPKRRLSVPRHRKATIAIAASRGLVR